MAFEQNYWQNKLTQKKEQLHNLRQKTLARIIQVINEFLNEEKEKVDEVQEILKMMEEEKKKEKEKEKSQENKNSEK